MWTSRTACGRRLDVREDLVERHRVAARLVRLRGERAEVAGGHAHVRVVDVRVPHEVGGVAVALLADVVGQRPERQQVVAAVERDAVLEGQALARQHLLADRLQRRVAGSRLDEWRGHEVSVRRLRPITASPAANRVERRRECAAAARPLPRPARVPGPAAPRRRPRRRRRAGRRAARGRRDPPPGDRRRRARAAVHARRRLGLPARHQPLRHAAARRAGLRRRGRCASSGGSWSWPRRCCRRPPASCGGRATWLGEALRVGHCATRARGPVTEVVTRDVRLDRLPVLTCWPEDGGPFVTLPLVYTEHPERARESNLGMYRLQVHDARTTGMHWQIGKGGGFHYAVAEARGEALPVTVFLGGPPALILAAVAPLPENVPELMLASLHRGRAAAARARPRPASARRRRRVRPGRPRPAAASGAPRARSATTTATTRCATTTRSSRSSRIAHRRDAIYPATVVGKPRQEDFFIGDLLQELLSPLFPLVMPGVRRPVVLRRDRLPLAGRRGREAALRPRGDGQRASASSARASSR